jgi:integrase
VRAMDLPGPYVFPSRMGKGGPHSNMAMLNTLTRLGWRSETTAHGFRSVLNTWATEETDHAQIVVDMALAHEIESKVEKAYRRGDLADRRLALLKDWESFLNSYVPPKAE